MKSVLLSILAAAMLAPITHAVPFQCLIECVEPAQHDPESASSCNCDERYCPLPEGPGGPNIPVGYVWGWNEATNSCGAVPRGDRCAGLDVTCTVGYSYGWNGVDTCQCLPVDTVYSKRQEICDIACVRPEAYDPHANSPSCNCAERVCPPISAVSAELICPTSAEVWGWDQETGECGCVLDPEAECVATGITCIYGYTYWWNPTNYTCQCLANPVIVG